MKTNELQMRVEAAYHALYDAKETHITYHFSDIRHKEQSARYSALIAEWVEAVQEYTDFYGENIMRQLFDYLKLARENRHESAQ